jgi:hypothetical protein
MAEELVGPSVFSFNLTVETPIDIDDMIYMLTPMDLPLTQGVNGLGVPILPTTPTSDTTFYWLEENMPLPRGILNEDLDTTETGIDMVAGDAIKFAVGDAIRIDDEVMIVTGVNSTTEVLTVTRGSAAETGTTAATHLTGATVIGLGSVLIEGAVGSSNFQGRDKFSNICQIWSKKLTMSATEQAIRKYGVPSELAHQTVAMLQHHATGKENAALYGVKFQHASNFRRQTGGLKSFLTTNVDAITDWLTVESIEQRQQVAYDQGGQFDVIVARPAAFAALNNTTGTERVQTVTIDDARRGRKMATTVMTEFGEVLLARDRHVLPTDAFGIKRGNFKYRQFRPTGLVRLAKTDDTDSYMVVAEGGFQVKGQDHMCAWTGLDTSAALPPDLV